MKGMTLDFACTRIFELESKKDVMINRLMIQNYIKSLKRGMDKNKEDYMKMNKLTMDELRTEHA